jgi:hypothetical protein
MASDDSSDDRVAARAEDLVVGRGRRRYRWFVRAVLAVLLVVLLVDAVWLVADALGTSPFPPAVVDGLWTLTAAALTLFLLTGLVQFLVLGRNFERGTEEVTQSAEELEKTAEEVAEAAEEVEKLSDTVATESNPDERTAEAVKEQADEIKGEMEGAERTADEVKGKLQEQGPPEDESDER